MHIYDELATATEVYMTEDERLMWYRDYPEDGPDLIVLLCLRHTHDRFGRTTRLDISRWYVRLSLEMEAFLNGLGKPWNVEYTPAELLDRIVPFDARKLDARTEEALTLLMTDYTPSVAVAQALVAADRTDCARKVLADWFSAWEARLA